jgi:ketosteroid isomerase-like protein
MLPAEDLARNFHAALLARDWALLRSFLTDDARWDLPGDNYISGPAEGAAAVVERARLIASYGVAFKLNYVLLSRDNMALSLHNTAERDGTHLDEHLATVCRLKDGRIREIETFLSDVPGMNRFFSLPPPR